MMNSSSIMRREGDYKLKRKALEAREEGDTGDNSTDSSRYSLKLSSSSTRQWSEYSKNPRIVRVSGSFEGKDRHSKVCTIRGLRDRRIRLSVPTAIQLFDLQDKLGLGQPSKVIDWLIDATKSDIDNLPPLQFPHGFGTDQFHQQMLLNSASQSSSFAPFSFGSNSTTFSKEDQDHGVSDYAGQVPDLTPRFFPVTGVFNSGTYHDWEPSNLSLSQFGNHGFQMSQGEENSLNNNIPNPNPMLLPFSFPLPSSHLFFGPSGTTIASTNHHPPYANQ